MKKYIFLLSILAFVALAPLAHAEKVDSFESLLYIQKNSSVLVQETVIYDFGIEQRHGIFRIIPIDYATDFGNRSVRISETSVTDDNGKPLIYKTSKEAGNFKFQIGDPAKLVTGVQKYVIRYRIDGAFNFFNDHDEFYWNVTGHDWQVPIAESFATVILPKVMSADEVQRKCYGGNAGSKTPCTSVSLSSGGISGSFNEVEFAQKDASTGGLGLTIVVGIPKGIVYEPSFAARIVQSVSDNKILLLPILVFAALTYLWYTRGRDPKGKGAYYPEYEPPDNLSPAEIGTIIDEKAQNRDISAEIINLAVRGYLKITRTEEKKFLSTQVDYTLERLKPGDDLENDFQKDLLRDLFESKDVLKSMGPVEAIETIYTALQKTKDDVSPSASGAQNKDDAVMAASKAFGKEFADAILDKTGANKEPPNVVRLSELKNVFHAKLQKIKNDVYDALVAKKYFPRNPAKIRTAFAIAGGAVIFSAFFLGHLFGIAGVISLVLCGVMLIVFGLFMPRKTVNGALAREHILGLKQYLSVAEKARLEFHNAPEKNPRHFEKLLPYAMVLGVEESWAKQFEGIYNSPPSWYSDPAGGAFNAVLFSHSLTGFSSQAGSTMSSNPGSAAGGGSGLGGGGFSGGGFGGGGGGSW
jgi:uncharacterized membrane protein